MAKKKRGPGQPTKYKPEYCQLLIDHMAEGYSFESFAGIVKTCKQTIYSWAEAHPEFLDAKKRGFAEAQVMWEKLGMEGVKGGNINPTMWIFNMKNRFQWSDRQQVETTNIEPVVVETSDGDKTEYKTKD